MKKFTDNEVYNIINSLPPKQFVKLLDSFTFNRNINDEKKSNAGRPEIPVDTEVILLYKLQGYSNRSISKELLVSPKTIDRRVNKLKEEGLL